MYERHDGQHHSCEGLDLVTKVEERLDGDDRLLYTDPKGRESKVIKKALVASKSLG